MVTEDRTSQAGGRAVDPESAPAAPTAVGEVPGSAATAPLAPVVRITAIEGEDAVFIARHVRIDGHLEINGERITGEITECHLNPWAATQ